MNIQCERCLVLPICKERIQTARYPYNAALKACKECYGKDLEYLTNIYADLCLFFSYTQRQLK